MSGYKRVNFYELCRLCATNQQKDKTHIFREEGRKIQLQTKIQSCLSLTVCENDSLPKVVCSKCLRTLEVCYTFRQECVSSESMLSTYFKNFRYTEDFKKSGKVYIKDTASKSPVLPTYQSQNDTANQPQQQQQSVAAQQQQQQITSTVAAPSTASVINATNFGNLNEIKNLNTAAATAAAAIDHHVPSFYTLQLPTAIVTNQQIDKSTIIKTDKILHSQTPTGYNISSANLAIKTLTTPQQQQQQPQQKLTSTTGNSSGGGGSSGNNNNNNNETLSNVVVNANGEVLHIAQLVDFESIINQANLQKKLNAAAAAASATVVAPSIPMKRQKLKEQSTNDEPIIKIDLTNNDLENYDHKTKHNNNNTNTTNNNNNNNNSNKFTGYQIKMDEDKLNQSVIFNNVTQTTTSVAAEYQTTVGNFNNYQTTNQNLYQTTTQATNTTEAPSTVNLNVLNNDSFTRNFIASSTTAATTTVPTITTNNNNNNNSNSSGKDDMTYPAALRTHICEICQKCFKRREHLYQHVKLHTGFRPYTCENCNKSFMRKEHLLRHMTSHSGQKNFTCNICDKSFSRNDNLLKHKKTHDKQASYTCDICQKQFVMKHYYLAHKLTHDGDRCITNVWNVLKT